jgi:hypothetical protein
MLVADLQPWQLELHRSLSAMCGTEQTTISSVGLQPPLFQGGPHGGGSGATQAGMDYRGCVPITKESSWEEYCSDEKQRVCLE